MMTSCPPRMVTIALQVVPWESMWSTKGLKGQVYLEGVAEGSEGSEGRGHGYDGDLALRGLGHVLLNL